MSGLMKQPRDPTKKPSRVFVLTNADCTRRRLDVARLQNYFLANGCALAASAAEADTVVLVTCAYTRKSEDLAVEMARDLGCGPGRLIVAGCLPAINPRRLKTVFSGEAVPTHALAEIDRCFPEFAVPFAAVEDGHRAPPAALVPSTRPSVLLRTIGSRPLFAARMFLKKRAVDRFRRKQYYIRTSWGCRGACSYCVIREAIGPLQSKPVEDCRRELLAAVASGQASVVLDGDDLGAYGLDRGSTLPELLRALFAADGGCVLDIEEINPRWLVAYAGELVPILATQRVRSLCCCLQSGSGRVLRLMNRYAETEKISAALGRIRAAAPALRLSAHVIVGFPSETEAEFEETIRAVEAGGFASVLVFGYQDKAGSRSAGFAGKIPAAAIAGRVKRFHSRLSRRGVDVLCV